MRNKWARQTLCERKKRATEALGYNRLVQKCPEITRIDRECAQVQTPTQPELFSDSEG